MHKYLKSYITVEASYLIPIVLILYCVLIMGGFYLYDRCVISQDAFLIALRGSRFSFASDNYGEVIYGAETEDFFKETYMERRLSYKSKFYPFLDAQVLHTEMTEAADVCVSGFNGKLNISKTVKIQNPLQKVREIRRESYGS